MGIRYDIQITALIPLHIFVYYLYKVASYSWCKKAFCSMIVGKIMSWIVITAKRKACGIKNEMRFSDGKTKCAIKKHPSNETWMLFC